jgi:integrase
VLGRHVAGPAKNSLREAKAAYRAKVQSILVPEPPPTPALPIVEDYAQRVLDEVYAARAAEGLVSRNTLELYEQILRLNLRGTGLGRKRLDLVVPADVERWCEGLSTQPRVTASKVFPSRPLSGASKARYLGMLSAILQYAFKKEKLIPSNPALEAIKPRAEQVDFRILSKDEVEQLLSLCISRRMLGVVLLGLHGFGPAEMCGLQKSDFDGEGITPRRQRQRFKDGVEVHDVLKTGKRRGWVAVDTRLRQFLNDSPDGWILHGAKGEALEPANIRRDLAELLVGTPFEGLRPYDLRHTFAQRLLDEGVDVQTAAELLRHSTETFLRRYVRSDRDRKLAAMRKLERGALGAYT